MTEQKDVKMPAEFINALIYDAALNYNPEEDRLVQEALGLKEKE